jgi:hypothetical protein
MIRYFAYGSDLNFDSIADWCSHADRPLPRREALRPAVLAHHRLCFPVYDSFWQGGVADIAPQPGKMVSGALMELSGHGLETLERMFGRSRSRRTIVSVTPYAGGPPVEAVTFRIGLPDICHIPPSQRYLHRLAQAASDVGLSMMWVMHLQSFGASATSERVEAMDSALEFARIPARFLCRARPRPDLVHSEPLELVS